MISDAFKAKVKAATNLKELVEEYTDMQVAGYNIWQGRCPHPDHDDSTSSFTVYYNKDGTWSWCCFGCSTEKKNVRNGSYGSDCFAFMMWMSDYKGSKHKISWPEAVKLLAEKAGIPMEQDKYVEIYRINRMRAIGHHKNMFPFVKEYLYERGLDDQDINAWNIGFGSFKETRYEDNKKIEEEILRVVFPLIDRYGQILGSSRRKFGYETRKEIPKYWNSPNSDHFHKRSYLYGIHNYDTSFDEIRITEGQFDVILSQKYGVKNIMAPLGTAFGEEHARFLLKEKKTPCFCLDGDAAGQNATRKKVSMLADMGVYAKVLLIPEGMDMADMANKYQESLEDYICNNAMPYWQYVLNDKAIEYDSKVNELRAKILPDILKACKGVKSDKDNILLKSYLKERFGINS